MRNLALDQSKIKNICEKGEYTNGVSSYILGLTKPLTNATNTISNGINAKNSSDDAVIKNFKLIYFWK